MSIEIDHRFRYAIVTNDEKSVEESLKLNPRILYSHIQLCNTKPILQMLLEHDPRLSNIVSTHTFTHIINATNARFYDWFFELLMDYGSNMGAPYDIKLHRSTNYMLFVKEAIAECRRALLALLSACNASKLHNRGGFAPKGAFGALRGIMIQIASQAWAMRGGEGCGARAHKWKIN